MGGPAQVLLCPDPLFTRAAALEASCTSLGTGGTTGPASPRSTNRGGLSPFLAGTPDPGVDLDFLLLRAGGLHEGAEWAWKKDTDAETDWYGRDDYRKINGAHDPFYDDVTYGYGLTAIMSSIYHRILLFRWSTGRIWAVRYRDLDDPQTTWTNASFTADRAGRTGAYALLDGMEADDGTLVLAVTHGTTTEADIDIYTSEDGGLTWTRVARDLLQTWSSGKDAVYRIKIRRSGQWWRIVYLDGGDNKLYTLVSSDRGASWAALTAFPSSGTIYSNGDNIDPWAWDFAGLDTADGAFVCYWVGNADANGVRVQLSSRNEEWAEDTGADFTAAGDTVERIAMALCSDALWVMLDQASSGIAHGWQMYRILRSDPFDTANRRTVAQWAPAYGQTRRYTPGFISLVEAGPSVLMLHALLDSENNGAAEIGIGCLLWSGYSRRSLNLATATGVDATLLTTHHWTPVNGAPFDTMTEASSITPLAGTVTGAASYVWSADELRLLGPDSTDLYRGDLAMTATPAQSWADASCIWWVAKVPQGGSLSANDAGARIIARPSAGSSLTDISLRWAEAGIRVYDEIASAELATVALSLTDWHEIRWAQTRSGSTYTGELSASKLYQTSEAWFSSGVLTLTAGASGVTTSQLLRFGLLSGHAAPGQCIALRSWSVSGLDACGQIGFVNPTSLRGMVASPASRYLMDGMSVWWGGGGGLEEDRFDAGLKYQHGLDALFTDSPSLDYQTVDDGEYVLVFDAGSGHYWLHGACGVFGLAGENRVRVQYANTNSWGSPLSAQTLSAVLYAGLTIQTINAGSIKLWDPNERIQPGELANLFLQVSGATDAAFGATLEVEANMEGGDCIVLSSPTVLGFTVGGKVDVLSDRAVGIYSSTVRARYMRVVLDGSPYQTANGDHRVGRILPGIPYTLPWPLEWTQTDSESGNFELSESRNGVRQGVQVGTARRNLQLSMVGDKSRVREGIRATVRSLAGYGAKPVVLVQDTVRPTASAILARFQGTMNFSNEAWYEDADGYWRQAGNMALEFEEEV